MRTSTLALSLVLIVVGVAHAACPPAYVLTPGQVVRRPEPGYTQLSLVIPATGQSLQTLTLAPNAQDATMQEWTVSANDAIALRNARNQHGSNNVRLRWSGAGQPCDVPFAFADETIVGGGGQATGATPGPDMTTCRATGDAWRDELARQHLDGRFAIVILTDDNQVCYTNPEIERQAVGDPIYVGIYTTDAYTWASPRFAPCSLQTSAPRYNAPASGTTVFGLLSGRQRGERVVLPTTPPSPQRCYDENVEISIEGRTIAGAATTPLRHNLRQYPRYHFTLQLGAYNATVQQHTFGLRMVDGKNVIYDRGPANGGPEYFASVVVYAFPRYLATLARSRALYPGRDLVHDQRPLDRLSLILGSGLSNPSRHLVAGFGVEVVNGISLTYTYSKRRISSLAPGVNLGDAFTGTAAEIPTSEDWTDEWAAGISLDLGYALRMFSR